jgi:PhzF family phenazine biosynthesis protein
LLFRGEPNRVCGPGHLLLQKSWNSGRIFAPAIGIAEDPITGNANRPLGAYLVKYDLMKHDNRRLSFEEHQTRRIRHSQQPASNNGTCGRSRRLAHPPTLA